MAFTCQNVSCGAKFTERNRLNQHRRFCRHQLPSIVLNATEKYAARQAKKRQRLDESGSSLLQLGQEELVDLPMDPDPPPSPLDELQSQDMLAPPVQAEPEPELLGRSHRKKRPTWKVLQSLPDLDPPPIQTTTSTSSSVPDTAQGTSQAQPGFVWKAVKTLRNSFGMWREYPEAPSHIPAERITPQSSQCKPATVPPGLSPSISSPSPSFPSSTASGILQWMWTGSATKSISEVARLISFLKSDAFNKEDLEGFDLSRETDRLDAWLNKSTPGVEDDQPNQSHPDPPQVASAMQAVGVETPSVEGFQSSGLTNPPTGSGLPMESGGSDKPPCGTCPMAGWRTAKVDIAIPDGKSHSSITDSPVFTVPGLQLRSLVEIIKSAFSDPESKSFHYTPFKSFWSPPSTELQGPELGERIYDELFSSDAMIEEHQRIHELPAEKFQGQELERVVASMMVWSDSTHLTDFGNASLWPIYLFFGNQSKYERAKPRLSACHHVAYMPKLPDSFNDWFRDQTGNVPSADVLAHCRRELMHQIWQSLLDDDFVHAYEHGIVILCPDGKYRRFYPRIFTYSADYPEKVHLATIRNMGSCPCPRCLVRKDQIFEIGTRNDRVRRTKRNDNWEFSSMKTARNWIYKDGNGIKSAAVERLLMPKSLVPTQNAFEALSVFFFSIREALVVDLMHEIELGIWKALFTHLIRILYLSGAKVVQELNRRYRLVPTFGDAIRRFSDDAASMTKMAARNFENLLQCAIPCFEELVPDAHNKEVLSLLYTMAEWHALAKLRLHTSGTLALLDESTTELGRLLRRFRTYTCSQFKTKELPSETAKKIRQAARKKAKGGASGAAPSQAKKNANEDKMFSLSTYKLHAVGHYVSTIQRFGTTDSYSTQTGELEHRRVKKYYRRTNKKDASQQMTRLERREHFFSGRGPLPAEQPESRPGKSTATKDASAHYVISSSRNCPTDITKFLSCHFGDPAITDFLPKLKKHILWRVNNPGFVSANDENDYSPAEYEKIHILKNRIFETKTVRINYTTYDLQRAQDFLGVGHEANVMLQSREEDSEQPFEYARILRVFHVDVIHQVPGGGATPQTFNILFVRRYKLDPSHRAGFKRKRLPRVQFLPLSDPDAFGFVDPDNIIRAVHLIPAFCLTAPDPCQVTESIAWAATDNHRWNHLYINIFADRDMYMRFRGGGIGHYHVPLPLDMDDLTVLPPETTEDLTDIIAQEVLLESKDNDDSDSSSNESSDDEDEVEDVEEDD